MHGVDIASTDLNLLVVLDVLLQERHVTGAARRLHRTQSAISHALGRLREQLGDPILVRVGGQMRPTPRAERLAGEVSLLAPPLLARTDLLMTVPRAVLADGAPRFGLVALPCPVKLAPIELSMYWSAQLDRDPAIVWFRQLLHEAATEAFAPREPLRPEAKGGTKRR